MIFGDYELAKRIERAESLNQRAFAETHERLRPGDSTCAVVPAGTGQAVFAGWDSPLTQAFGLGFGGEVRAPELEALEEFFRTRGAPANIEVSQFAHISLWRLLVERGYTVSELSNVLALSLSEVPEFALSGLRTVRRIQPAEIERAAETISAGFLEFNPGEQPIPDDFLDMFITAQNQSNNQSFAALSDAPPKMSDKEKSDSPFWGIGALYFVERVAFLGGASTIPMARGRGIQSDLIRARLNNARSEGCDIAVVSTQPGSVSQRNMQKFGFRIVYSRVKFTKLWA